MIKTNIKIKPFTLLLVVLLAACSKVSPEIVSVAEETLIDFAEFEIEKHRTHSLKK